jgi:hypothetical protein
MNYNKFTYNIIYCIDISVILYRTTFRKAFSTMCLRHHLDSIAEITAACGASLEAAAAAAEAAAASPDNTNTTTPAVVRIDDVFQSLTIEIICKLAFEMDVSRERSSELRVTFQSIFEVIQAKICICIYFYYNYYSVLNIYHSFL